MDPERWRRIEEIYQATLEQPTQQRAAYVAQACAGDAGLREQVESLLTFASKSSDFIEEPALEIAAREAAKGGARQAGDSIGHYVLQDEIGAGGMGVVYRAIDTRLGRTVAIKMLRDLLPPVETDRARLLREARTSSSLNHAGICTTFEVGEAEGQIYIVMEYVDGRPLSGMIPAGGLAAETVCRFGVQIADALAHAHERAVIHRDLKGSNVMITKEGRVKVLDFGLAKRLPQGGSAPQSQTLTESGILIGTPTHMAPEVHRGEKPSVASDLWSLGILLYELASGTLPFKGHSPVELGAAILKEPAAPLPVRTHPALAGTIQRCLAKDVADRYHSAIEVRAALEAAGQGTGPIGRPVLSTSRRTVVTAADMLNSWKEIAQYLKTTTRTVQRWEKMEGLPVHRHLHSQRHAVYAYKPELDTWWRKRGTPSPIPSRPGRVVYAALAAVIVAFAAGVTWWLSRPTGIVRPPALTQLTFDSGLTTDPTLSSDGKLVAYASDRLGLGNLDIWLQSVGTGEARRLTQDSADESEPAFSPDGSRIAFHSEKAGGGIYVISILGGEARLIARNGRRPRFSPDGSRIVYWIGGWYKGQTFVAPAAGGPPVQVQPEFYTAAYPIWSPDGRHILFVGARTQPELVTEPDWWTAPSEGGPAIATGAAAIFRKQGIKMEWAALVTPGDWHGDQVFFSARAGANHNLRKLGLSTRTLRATNPPERISFGTSVEDKPAGSAERLVFSSLTSNLNIWAVPIDANHGKIARKPQRLTHGAFDANNSASSDGKKIVFVSNRSGNRDVWLKDLTTGRETALTTTTVEEESAEITPDGGTICYTAIEDKWNIYVMSLGPDGAPSVPERVCEGCERAWDWSPDKKTFLYLPMPLVRLHLGSLNLVTRQRSDVLKHPKYELARARFSPDGRWIAFVAGTGAGLFSRNRIAIVPADPPQDEERWIWITDDSTFHEKPRWSPDGNLLYYTSDRDGFRCIRAQRLDPVSKRPIGAPFDVYHSHGARTSLMNAGIQFLDISLTPNRLIFNLEERAGNIWLAKHNTK